MPPEEGLVLPPLSWRIGSTLTIGVTGLIARSFLYGLSRTQVNGLDNFLKILDERKDVCTRQRGLITVSNHISVMDDPAIWGVLPFRYHYTPDNIRWSLGSHDICFKNSFTSKFFPMGQTLPTHRLAHSPYGGLFQPTFTQAIRLLSAGPFRQPTNPPTNVTNPPTTSDLASRHHNDVYDPFSTGSFTYTTNNIDSYPAPSAYANRKHAWIHIFPEGRVHQKTDKTMRYFKWGVSRLILESDPCPDVVPMWIEGMDSVMHESRKFPRFIPRPGKDVNVTFGAKVDLSTFESLRERWQQLVKRHTDAQPEHRDREGGIVASRDVVKLDPGILTEELMYGAEAVQLRKECTTRVREEVLKVRRTRGLPDEDPKSGLVETWIEEGKTDKRAGRMGDGSWVGRT